jgi:hypothetical protein
MCEVIAAKLRASALITAANSSNKGTLIQSFSRTRKRAANSGDDESAAQGTPHGRKRPELSRIHDSFGKLFLEDL